MERAHDGILEVQWNLLDDLAFEEDDNASTDSEEEVLSDLIDIGIGIFFMNVWRRWV